jgi:hypothetical protein
MKIYQMPEMASVARLQTLAEWGSEYRDWYKQAQADITTVCVDEGWNVERFIDVLALTSVRTSVRRNIRVTMSYMRDGTLPKDVIRSTHQALAHYEQNGIIRGPKTGAFAKCLKGYQEPVVLDTWMAMAFEVDQRLFTRRWVRKHAEQQVRFVAELFGVYPAQAQAMIWAGTIIDVGRNVPVISVSDELTYRMES